VQAAVIFNIWVQPAMFAQIWMDHFSGFKSPLTRRNQWALSHLPTRLMITLALDKFEQSRLTLQSITGLGKVDSQTGEPLATNGSIANRLAEFNTRGGEDSGHAVR
jgi:hypothetical protein